MISFSDYYSLQMSLFCALLSNTNTPFGFTCSGEQWCFLIGTLSMDHPKLRLKMQGFHQSTLQPQSCLLWKGQNKLFCSNKNAKWNKDLDLGPGRYIKFLEDFLCWKWELEEAVNNCTRIVGVYILGCSHILDS